MEVSMSKTRRGKYTDNRICYISKCKGDMRLYLRRKGKLPCFSYLVRGKSFSFYRGKIRFSVVTSKCFAWKLFPFYFFFIPFFAFLLDFTLDLVKAFAIYANHGTLAYEGVRVYLFDEAEDGL